MKLIETQWWAIPLPDEWRAQTEEGTVIISDLDGIGILELSVIELDGPEPGIAELEELSAEIVPADAHGVPAHCGDWEGLRFDYTAGDYCRDWVLKHGQQVLLVSYTCAIEHSAMDDAAVDEMLGELSVVRSY